LDFRNCLQLGRNKSDFELRFNRSSTRSDWIELALRNQPKRNELILIADSHEIADYNDKHPNQPLKILDRRIIRFSDFLGKEHAFMNPLFKKTFVRLLENGLLERIIEKWVDLVKVRPPPLESEPKVLTFDHVGVAFKIAGGFLALSVVTFVFEELVGKLVAVHVVIAFQCSVVL